MEAKIIYCKFVYNIAYNIACKDTSSRRTWTLEGVWYEVLKSTQMLEVCMYTCMLVCQLTGIKYWIYRFLEVSIQADSVNSGKESFGHGNVGVALIVE